MASAALAWVGLSEERCIKGSPGFEGRLPLRKLHYCHDRATARTGCLFRSSAGLGAGLFLTRLTQCGHGFAGLTAWRVDRGEQWMDVGWHGGAIGQVRGWGHGCRGVERTESVWEEVRTQ